MCQSLLVLAAVGMLGAQDAPFSKGDYFARVKKVFARLVSIDAKTNRVTFVVDGTSDERTLQMIEAAELIRNGTWARAADFSGGLRVWIWIDLNRKSEWTRVRMIADELSSHDIHVARYRVASVEGGRLRLEHKVLGTETLEFNEQTRFVMDSDAPEIGDEVVFQTRYEGKRRVLRRVADGAGLERLRKKQHEQLVARWKKAGIPGTLTQVNPASAEVTLLIDHEGREWTRTLQPGAEVKLVAADSVAGRVRAVRPAREKTELTIVINGLDQASLEPGARVGLIMDPPEAIDPKVPAGLGRSRDRGERIEWLLASIYCTCGNRRNVCVGHFYTLAACLSPECPMPERMRRQFGELIDQGKSDREIYDGLLEKRGALIRKQHLMP